LGGGRKVSGVKTRSNGGTWRDVKRGEEWAWSGLPWRGCERIEEEEGLGLARENRLCEYKEHMAKENEDEINRLGLII